MRKWRTIVGFLLLGGFCAARWAWAGSPPTSQEQYMLEELNRLRLDPDGEVYRLRGQTWGDAGSPQPPDLNEGITTKLLTPETRQPLAFNDLVIQAARNYSQTLLDNNAFQHEYGGTTPQTRMQAAGYVFTTSWGWGENLALTYANYSLPINASIVDSQQTGLFIDGDVADRGHRRNLLSGSMKEVGVGIASTASATYTPPGGSGTWYAVISTQDFAYSAGSSGGKAFLTGVVYTDLLTNNAFYDPGEGLGGVTVAATPVGGGAANSVTTWSSGGYSLPLAAGVYNVTVSGGNLPNGIKYANVSVGATNVKLDAAINMGVWNSDANGDWAVSGNWSGTPPSGTGKAAIFAGKATAPRTINLSSPQTLGAISFNNATAGYTISGSSVLTLNLPGDRARAFVYAGRHSVGTPISLASGLDVTVLSATDSLSLAGAISGGTAQSVVKLGKGTLTLSASNTFSGGLTVTDGTVVVDHNNGLGTGAVTLGFASDTASIVAGSPVQVANAIQVAAGPGGSCTLGTALTSGTAAFSGAITLNQDLTMTAPLGGWLAVSGTVSGSGHLLKTGGGKLVLSGSNSYLGGTNVSGGILIVSSDDALPSGTDLFVGAGGSFLGGATAAAVPPAVPDQATAVPEPSTTALLVVGAVGALGWRWRFGWLAAAFQYGRSRVRAIR